MGDPFWSEEGMRPKDTKLKEMRWDARRSIKLVKWNHGDSSWFIVPTAKDHSIHNPGLIMISELKILRVALQLLYVHCLGPLNLQRVNNQQIQHTLQSTKVSDTMPRGASGRRVLASRRPLHCCTRARTQV